MINKKEDDQIINVILNIVIIVILTIYFKGYFTMRYYDFIPTVKVYPENNKEIDIVNNYVEENNKYYIDLFKKTDLTVVNAFQELVEVDRKKLIDITSEIHLIIVTLTLKIFFNRARPKQVNPNLNVQESTTANTPAYPSGHCIQAYYLAKKLSKMFPSRESKLYKLAEDCAMARVYAGLHYPSDNEFGKYIALNIL